MSHLTNNR